MTSQQQRSQSPLEHLATLQQRKWYSPFVPEQRQENALWQECVTCSGFFSPQSHILIYERNFEYPGHRAEALRNYVPNGLTKKLSHRNEKGEKVTQDGSVCGSERYINAFKNKNSVIIYVPLLLFQNFNDFFFLCEKIFFSWGAVLFLTPLVEWIKNILLTFVLQRINKMPYRF